MTEKEFIDFVEMHRDDFKTVAMKYLRDSFIADDIVQDSIETLLKMRNELIPKSARSYAMTTVRNKTLNYQIRARRKLEYQSMKSNPETPHELLSMKEIELLIDNFIASLNPKHQMIYMARVVDGRSLDEIANEFAETKNNVTVILSRLRKSIHQIVSDYGK